MASSIKHTTKYVVVDSMKDQDIISYPTLMEAVRECEQQDSCHIRRETQITLGETVGISSTLITLPTREELAAWEAALRNAAYSQLRRDLGSGVLLLHDRWPNQPPRYVPREEILKAYGKKS